MAEIKWTKDQYDAIHAQDGTVLVSAAAGSGKTAVLVARVLDLIMNEENPCNVDSMLIVTFTKAAAAQMREKIAKKISAELRNDPNNTHLLRQKMLLPNAKICTIDSFCNDVVKTNYHKTNISPNTRILDESERKYIMQDAFEETVEYFYDKKDKNFKALVDFFSSMGDDNKLQNVVFKMYEFSCAYPKPEKWIKTIPEGFESESTKYMDYIIDYAKMQTDYCIELSKYATKLLEDDSLATEKYADALADDSMYFRNLLDKLNAFSKREDWDDIYETIKSRAFLRVTKPSGKGYVIETIAKIRDMYRNKTSSLHEKLCALFCATDEQDKEDMKKIYPAMKSMSEFLIEFSSVFSRKKSERNCSDFSDILHSALSLVLDEDGNPTEIARQYSDKFSHILIDEYQDTNYAQDALFSAVSKNESNLFFVGDVKQSIYGFRQAMPELFIEKRKSYNRYSGDNYPANIALGQNFRSREDITKCVNFIFSQIMSEEMGDIDYNEDEELVYSAPYPDSDEIQNELHIIPEIEDVENDVAEAEYLTVYIKNLLASGMMITDGDIQRKIQKKDICILLRSASSRADEYVKRLNAAGIDSFFGDNGKLLETSEIRVLFSFLQVIDNPLNDIPLLSVMMSPMFGFTPDEIAEIKINGEDGMSLYNYVEQFAEKGNEKCAELLKTISMYRLMSGSLSPCELIDKIIDESGYAELVLAMSNGKSRRDNLYLFRDYASNYSGSNNIGLTGFIRITENVKKQSAKINSAPKASSGADAVTVMTIHKSKGLEFPVCILAGCSHMYNEMELNDDIIINQSMGIGVIGKDSKRLLRHKTLSHTALRLKAGYDLRAEELRVLYVAMTRAKEKLVMLITDNKVQKKLEKISIDALRGKPHPFAVRNCKSYGELLLLSLVHHPDAISLRRMIDSSFDTTIKADFPLRIVIGEQIKEMAEIELDTENVLPDKDVISKIDEKASYVYPYSALKGVPVKRGASDPKRGLNREFFASSRPAFMGKEGLSPAQKGTAMHLFMQHCDYKSAAADIENEISNLVEKGFINTLEAESLNRKKLRAFFGSPLANRMFSSNNLMREKKFILEMQPFEIDENFPKEAVDEKIIVQGILDCAFEEDGKIVIVDYKTDRVVDEDELKARYSDQLHIYEKAVRECLSMEIKETVIYSFHLGKEIIL